MADLAGLEREFMALCVQKDWAGARNYIRPFIASPDQETAGWARVMLAFALADETIRNIPACLILTDEAVSLLQRFPEQLARALIRGMRYAQVASRSEVYKDYAKAARRVADGGHEQVRRWKARLLIWVAYYHRYCGDMTQAVRYLEQAIKAAQSDTVSTPKNRRCDLNVARYALADVLLETGHQQPAVDALRHGMRIDPDITPESRLYLQGHLELERGNAEQAKRALLDALKLAKERRDTPLVRRIAVALADAYHLLGEVEQLAPLLNDLIAEYSGGKMYTVALQLQRVLNRVSSGEGIVCEERRSGS